MGWETVLLIPDILGCGRTEPPLNPLSEFAEPALSAEESFKECEMVEMNRRTWLQGAAATLTLAPQAWAKAPTGWVGLQLSQGRPAPGGRRFTSAAVDALIPLIQRRIADPALAAIF